MYQRHFPPDTVFEELMESLFDRLKDQAVSEEECRSVLESSSLLKGIAAKIESSAVQKVTTEDLQRSTQADGAGRMRLIEIRELYECGGSLYEAVRKPFWFEPGFPPNAKNFILKQCQQQAEYGMGCQTESEGWYKILKGAGFDVEIHDGMFYPKGDIDEGGEGHTWLVVNGFIFDPTASQFSGRKDSDYYEATDEWESLEDRQRSLGY